MPFDGIVTRAVTLELKQQLVGGKINKIYQPTKTELILTIRNERKNYALLISIHPTYARFHLTEHDLTNPFEPPMFCMVLRKHLQGTIITDIKQIELERIVSIEIKGRDEIGDDVDYQLMIETMGKHSNVSLLYKESEKIIHCMKVVTMEQNRHRTLLPGVTYQLPPAQNKLNLLTATDGEFIQKLDFNQGKMEKQIVNAVTGLSPFIAKEIVTRCHLGSQKEFASAFKQFQQDVTENQFEPAIYQNSREDFHVIPIQYLEKKQSFESISQLLDTYYVDKAERDRMMQQTRDLRRKIVTEIEKNKRKQKIHLDAINEEEQAHLYQKYGELLTANMHLIKQGDKQITVIDYYDEAQNEISIPLKQSLTPSENAQRYFKRYRKLKTAAEMAEEEIKKAEEEINYLEIILQQLEQANEDDLEEIKNELEDEGYIKKQHKKRKKQQKMIKPSLFKASDGTEIYVGKNNKQNEYATFKLANKEDIWLHTLNIPGSHVIIKASNPTEKTLLEAAQLAAYFSKAKESTSVPVDYTKVKYVKKVAGAKPGFVTYSNQKTLFVSPKLLKNE